MSDETLDPKGSEPAAPPAPSTVTVRRSPTFANLDVELDDGTPMPPEGAEVNPNAQPWASMLERDILVIVPPKKA